MIGGSRSYFVKLLCIFGLLPLGLGARVLDPKQGQELVASSNRRP